MGSNPASGFKRSSRRTKFSGFTFFPQMTESSNFRNMPLAANSERDLLRRAIEHVIERLPEGWKTDVALDVPSSAGRADAVIELTAPDGTAATLIVECKRTAPTSADARSMIEQLSRYTSALGRPAVPLLAARYFSPAVRELLDEREVGYADATGNMRVRVDRPALFLRDTGASRDPWRGPGRPAGDLKGAPAARLVRALIDFRPPYGLPDLAERSGASVGATYRLIDFLEREALVTRQIGASPPTMTTAERGKAGPIIDVDWPRLLVRWSQEFRIKAPPLQRYLQPRGIDALLEALRPQENEAYVLTGSVAAARFAPYAPARLAVLYADDPAGLAAKLSLREVDAGANVLLGAPVDAVIFERSEIQDGLRIAAPSQIAADLLNGPGREPEEATALVDWMKANEPAWRR